MIHVDLPDPRRAPGEPMFWKNSTLTE